MNATISSRFGELTLGMALALAVVCTMIGILAGIEPTLAIGAALGLAFVLVAFADLTAGLVVFTLGVFLEYVLPGGAALSFPKLGGALLGLSWLALVTTRQSARPTFLGAHPGPSFLIGAFLAWAVLSATWADDTAAAITDVSRYAPNFLLLLIVFTAVRSRRDVGLAIAGLLAGILVTAIYGLIVPPDPTDDPLRLESSAGNANTIATLMVAGVALSIGAATALRRNPLAKVGLGCMAALCIATAVLTGSRGGLVALTAALLAAILLGGRWRPSIAIGAVALSLLTVVFVTTFAPAEIEQRLTESAPGQDQVGEDPRLTIWRVGWRMVEAAPVNGVGVGNFAGSAASFVLQPGRLPRTDQIIDTPKVAHNTYLHVLAELGVIGACLFIAIVAFCLGSALRAARRFRALGDAQMEAIARALAIAIIAALAAGFFGSDQFFKVLWLMLALGPALAAVAARERAAAGQRRRPPGIAESSAR